MIERRTTPWAKDEYAYFVSGDGQRFPLVYSTKTMDMEGNILWYIGPGGRTFDAGDPQVRPPVRKRCNDA
jgi:hypothetical protein